METVYAAMTSDKAGNSNGKTAVVLQNRSLEVVWDEYVKAFLERVGNMYAATNMSRS